MVSTYVHAISSVIAVVLGFYIMGTTKGTPRHKKIGKIWVVLMFIACLSSFGIKHWGYFNVLHAGSIFALFGLFVGLMGNAHGLVRLHATGMICTFIGLLANFYFAVMTEGRIAHNFIFKFLPGR